MDAGVLLCGSRRFKKRSSYSRWVILPFSSVAVLARRIPLRHSAPDIRGKCFAAVILYSNANWNRRRGRMSD